MIVQIPRSKTWASLSCPKVPVEIHGVVFPANLIVLGTEGIDVILGMSWMSKYQGKIDCTKKSVNLTSDEGVQVEYVAKPAEHQAFCPKSVSGPSLEQVHIVCEFLDVFFGGVTRY